MKKLIFIGCCVFLMFFPLFVSIAEADDFESFERVDLRTEFSKTYQVGEKLFEYEEYSTPVHYLDDGKWQEIDNTVYEKNERFENGNSWFDFDAPNSIRGEFEYQGPNGRCVFSLIGDGLNKEVRGEIDQNIVKYPNVFDGNTLVLSVNGDGIRTEIVLDSYEFRKEEYQFLLKGCEGISFDHAIMSDGDSLGVVSESREITDDGEVLRIRPEYRTLENVVGEVRIDPSITLGMDLDVFTSVNCGNGGGRRFLVVGNFYDTTNGAYCGTSESYFLFHYFLPSDAIITDARLSLYRYANGGGGFDATISALTEPFSSTPSRSDWAEKESILDTVYIDGGDLDFREYTFEFTDALVNWKTGISPNYGIGVFSWTAPDYAGAAFCSSRSDGFCLDQHDPKIQIIYEYNHPPYTPAIVSPSSGESIGGGCNEVTSVGCVGQKTVQFLFSNLGDPDSGGGSYLGTYLDITQSTQVSEGVFLDNSFVSNQFSESSFSQLLDDGRYTIRALSKDQMGELGIASLPISLNVDTRGPTAPLIASLPLYTPLLQIDIDGGSSFDSVYGESDLKYRLEYSQSSSFGIRYYSSWMSDPDISVSSNIHDQNRMYFRLQSRDPLLNLSRYSPTVSTIIDNQPPQYLLYGIGEYKTPLSTIAYSNFQRFSPHGLSSVGVSDELALRFEFEEPFLASSGGTVTRASSMDDITLDSSDAIFSDIHDNQYTYIWKIGSDPFFSSDGSYTAQVFAKDFAGNTLLRENVSFVVDNSPAVIVISDPVDNWYTRDESIRVMGQSPANTVEGLEDKDISRLWYEFDGASQTITRDSNGFLSFDFDLEPQKIHDIEIKSIDNVGNRYEISRKIIRDTISPEFSWGNFSEDFTSGEFQVNDGGEFDSGLRFGTASPNIRANLSYEVFPEGSEETETLDLLEYENNLLLPDFFGPVSCERTNLIERNQSEATLESACSYEFLSPFPHDTSYQMCFGVRDVAHNENVSCQNFEIDRHTFLSLLNQFQGDVSSIPTKSIDFLAEKGSLAGFEVVGRRYSFEVDEGSESELQNFSISCGVFEDIDDDLLTPDDELCEVRFDYEFPYSLEDVDVVTPYRIDINDMSGNTAEANDEVLINTHAFELEFSSSLLYISPNGDGNQDGLSFFQSAFETGGVSLGVSSYTISLSSENDEIVWESNGFGLPEMVYFDGNVCFGSTNGSQFSLLECEENGGTILALRDGVYIPKLTIMTEIGVERTVIGEPIRSLLNLSSTLVITSPRTGFVTTRGVLAIEGESAQIFGEEFSRVDVCVDELITLDDLCDFHAEASFIDGHFVAIVILPGVMIDAVTSYRITAYGTDRFGTRKPSENVVEVKYDVEDPFVSLSLSPVLVGINTPGEYEEFERGERSIDELRYTRARMEVSENTEGVEIRFGGSVDLSFRGGNRWIATIDDTRDLDLRTNPQQVQERKANTGLILEESNLDRCLTTVCLWEYAFPIEVGMAGVYEIEFMGKKGQTREVQSLGIQVDSSIPAAPDMLFVAKKYDNTDEYLHPILGTYYSNSPRVSVKGVAEPNSIVMVSRNDGSEYIQVGETGMFHFEYVFDNEGCKEFSVSSSDDVYTTIGNSLSICFDRTPPEILNSSVLPEYREVQTGASAVYFFEISEPVQYCYLQREDGYLELMHETEGLLSGNLEIERESEGRYYPKVFCRDRAENTLWFSQDDEGLTKKTTVLLSETTQMVPFDQKFDIHLVVDNTPPLAPIFDTSGFEREGGMKGNRGEMYFGRLNPGFVISSKSVEIPLVSENNTTVQYFNNGLKIIEESVLCAEEICESQMKYDMETDGVGNAFGYPDDGYLLQATATDRAGNTSEFSSGVVWYHDIDSPKNDFGPQQKSSILNSKYFSIDFFAEILSDIEVQTYFKDEFIRSEVAQNDLTRDQQLRMLLSDSSSFQSDDRSGCVKIVDGIRTGICSDGKYYFTVESFDAPGNSSIIERFDVWRDTVSPSKPEVDLSLSFDVHRRVFSIDVSMTGEKDTYDFKGNPFKGEAKYTLQEIPYDLASTLYTYRYYCFDLTDMAGNVSTKGCDFLTDQEIESLLIKYRPIQASNSITNASLQLARLRTIEEYSPYYIFYKGMIFQHPIPEYRRVSSHFGDGRSWGTHGGTDFITMQGCGSMIYAAADGVVTRVVSGYGSGDFSLYSEEELLGMTNLIEIRHDNGVITRYLHLDTVRVRKGDSVSRGDIIGTMGSSGYSTGCHLHFEITNNDWIKTKVNSEVLFAKKNLILKEYVPLYEYELSAFDDVERIEPIDVCGLYLVHVGFSTDHSKILLLGYENNDPSLPIIEIRDGFASEYLSQMTNNCNSLGSPIMTSKWVYEGKYYSGELNSYTQAPYDNEKERYILGLYQEFEFGAIYSMENVVMQGKVLNDSSYMLPTPKGDAVIGRGDKISVFGEIYLSYKENATTFGSYDFPVSSQYQEDDDSWCQDFVGGQLCGGDSGNIIERPFQVQGDDGRDRVAIKFFLYRKSNHSAGEEIYNHYDGKSRIWILSHGWQVGSFDPFERNIQGYFGSLAEVILDEYPEDIVLILDWRSGSHCGLLSNEDSGCSIPGLSSSEAAHWIRPTAKGVYTKLYEWGFTPDNNSNLNLVGHSLGSYIVAEISHEMGLQTDQGAEFVTYLDPASFVHSGGVDPFDGYDAYSPDTSKEYTHAQHSTVWLGEKSIASDMGRVKDADFAISIDYGTGMVDVNLSKQGYEHGWMQQTYKDIFSHKQTFAEDVLNSTHLGSMVVWDNPIYKLIDEEGEKVSAKIRVNDENMDINFLYVQESGRNHLFYNNAGTTLIQEKYYRDKGPIVYHGGDGDDTIQFGSNDFNIDEAWGGAGSDTFSSLNDSSLYYGWDNSDYLLIRDFQKGDRIVLSNGRKSRLKIVDNGMVNGIKTIQIVVEDFLKEPRVVMEVQGKIGEGIEKISKSKFIDENSEIFVYK